MPRARKHDNIEAYLDGDDIDKKAASGGYLMVGGCRLHSHSRTTGQHARSSGEEAKLTQYNLEFCGMFFCQLSCTQMPVSSKHFVTREVMEE